MGTWDVGPFDNDSAADWCGEFNDAVPDQRPALISQTLAAVAACAAYLDSDDAVAAIAAAAIVAAQRGGPPITSPYAPDFLVEGGTIELPDESAALAVRALDRVVADDSGWKALWEESDAFPEAAAVVARLREVLVV